MAKKVTCINCRSETCTGCKGDGVPVPPKPTPIRPEGPKPVDPKK